MEEFASVIAQSEASARKYLSRTDETGAKLKLSGDLKMTTFDCFLPVDLEKHVVLKKTGMNTYEAQKEEIEGISSDFKRVTKVATTTWMWITNSMGCVATVTNSDIVRRNVGR